MPRLNNTITPGAQKKFNRMSLTTSDSLWTHEVYVMESVAEAAGDEGDQSASDLGFMNLLNIQLRSDTPAAIKIPLKTVSKLPSDNGIIRCRILGASQTPLSTQTKGGNTIEWLENNKNLTLELEVPLPQTNSQYFFFFTDPFHNQVPEDPSQPSGAQKIGAQPFYKTSERPKIDNLNTSNEIIGQYIDITAALSAFLMNEETGASQEVIYTTGAVIPQNARYLKIEFESYHLANSIEVTRSGNPISITYIDEGNASSLGITNPDFISDEYYVDLIDPRNSLVSGQTKPILRSTMSGEIHNKFRIWETLFVGANSPGDFDFGVISKTNNEGQYSAQGFGRSVNFYNLPANIEGAAFAAPGSSLSLSSEILDCFRGGNAGEASKFEPWYNEFSFFSNLYSVKQSTVDQGNPLWKTSFSFFMFDVELATAVIDTLWVSNPKYSISNPNLTNENYRQIIRDLWTTGTTSINGVSFSGWPTKWETVTKDDKIYNWENNDENKKYLGLTPKLSYVERQQKLIDDGGQASIDNDVNVKIGKIQTTSARHPFPIGSGSIDIHYPPNVWYSRPYADSNNYPTENKVVFDLGEEGSIAKLLINNFAGIQYRITWYDNELNPATGKNADGEDEPLKPFIIKAPNVDNRNQPLSNSIQIIYGV